MIMAKIVLPISNIKHVTITPEKSGEGLASLEESQIKTLYKTHGAILFRGFELNLDLFDGITKRFCIGAVMNESGGRDVIDSEKNIQTVNLGAEAFPLHPELAREPWKPDVCFFACDTPPSAGGETTICDGIEIVENLPPPLKRRLIKERLLYMNIATPGELKYWLGTETPADGILKSPPPQCPFKFARRGGNIIRYFSAPFLHRTMFQDKFSFGNFLLFSWYYNGRQDYPVFESGALVDESIVETIKSESDKLVTPIKWAKNDLLMLDNTRFLHGRNIIKNTSKRAIYSYFGYLKFALPNAEEIPNAPWRGHGKGLYVEGLATQETGGLHKRKIELDRILRDPNLFLFEFLGSDAQLVEMNQKSYQESIFLDSRICRANVLMHKVKLTELYDHYASTKRNAAPLSFIFHIAHCGSTLLARAMDLASNNIVYKEPYVLRQLGVIAAAQYNESELPMEWRRALMVSTNLLGKRYDPNGPAIIKANVPVNFMIPQLMSLEPKHKALLLYMTLDDYLLAILKSPSHKAWLRSVSEELGNAIGIVAGIGEEERKKMSVVQSAACLWLVQMFLYSQVLDQYSNVKSLDAEKFFTQPGETLSKLFEFFGNPQDGDSIKKIVNSELFSRYSKDPRYSYDNDRRLADKARLRSDLDAEIGEARQWLDQHLSDCQIPEKLVASLLGDSPILIG